MAESDRPGDAAARPPVRISAGQRRLFAVLALAIGCALAALTAEIGLRLALASTTPALAALRNPSLYADYRSDDDWWKLYLKTGGMHKPPATPHPLLGWVHNFDRETYVHDDEAGLAGRRPVLLFGDSFADCVDGAKCFEELLNVDPEFSGGHYLLNYGVGGYGLDQIYLLMKQVIGRFDRPIVVFSFMLEDLDRCIIRFRGGQKPVFTVHDGALQLANVPIDPDPYHWLEHHPVSIDSYLFALLRRAPHKVWGRLTGTPWVEESRTADKQAVGGKVLVQALQDLRASGLDFRVLVFHPFTGPSWRDGFVHALLEEQRVDYLSAKQVVQEDMGAGDVFSLEARRKYMLPDLDHPNTLQNDLIAQRLKRSILDGR